MPEFDVRRLHPDDWRTLREVRLAALQDTPSAFASTYEEQVDFTEADWRQRLRLPTWIAFDGERAVGMVGIWRSAEGLAYLLSMWVEPAVRGSSAAEQLVLAALDWAQAEGLQSLALRVVVGNPRAEAFYRRLGFVPNGVTATLDDGRPEIEMEHRFGG